MKLSAETLSLLKNYSTINPSVLFKQGNTLTTISPQRSILAKATIKEDIPQQFGIGELNMFLASLSMFKDPELRFFDNYLEIFSGNQKIRYTYADPSVIIVPPEKELAFPEPEVELDLSAEELNTLLKAVAVIGLPHIAFTGDGDTLQVRTVNMKNSTTNIYSTTVGTTDKKFNAVVRVECLKLLPRDYHVSISSKGIIKFEAQDILYFVASDDSSTFN